MEKFQQTSLVSFMVSRETSNMNLVQCSSCHLLFRYNFLEPYLAARIENLFEFLHLFLVYVFVSHHELVLFVHRFLHDFENLCNFCFCFYHCFMLMTKSFTNSCLYKCFWILLELFVLLLVVRLQEFFESHTWILSNEVFHVSSPARVFHSFNRWFTIVNTTGNTLHGIQTYQRTLL